MPFLYALPFKKIYGLSSHIKQNIIISLPVCKLFFASEVRDRTRFAYRATGKNIVQKENNITQYISTIDE